MIELTKGNSLTEDTHHETQSQMHFAYVSGWSNMPLWFVFVRAVSLRRVLKINKTS